MATYRKPSTLQEICLQAVLRRYVNVTRVVGLMRFFDQIDWMIEQGPLLRGKCTQFIVQTYSSMERKYSHEELEDILGDDLVSRLGKENRDIKAKIKQCKIVGKVLERQTYRPPRSISAPVLRRSVSGKNAYTYGELWAGRAWPDDVDASCREEYLDATEFQYVFKIPYEEYKKYPKWRKIQLKKENKLF